MQNKMYSKIISETVGHWTPWASSVYLFSFFISTRKRWQYKDCIPKPGPCTYVRKRTSHEGGRRSQCKTVYLVILTNQLWNASHYYKLGVQVRLSISVGEQVERGRCGNHARRILHQSGQTSRQLRPDRHRRPTCVCPPFKLSNNTTVKQPKVFEDSKFEPKLSFTF